MVIGYLYIVGVAAPPGEAHAELIVDPNAVPAFPVTAKLFQSVAGRDSQILQPHGGMDGGKFSLGDVSQIGGRHRPALPCFPEFFRVLVRERLDHETEFNECRY